MHTFSPSPNKINSLILFLATLETHSLPFIIHFMYTLTLLGPAMLKHAALYPPLHKFDLRSRRIICGKLET